VLQVGGTCKGSLHHGFSLWNIVTVLYEIFRPGSTKSSSYRSLEYVLQVRGLARETSIIPYGILVQCCTRSAGQVPRSPRAIGPWSMCVASEGTCKGNGHHSLWDIVSLLYEVCRPVSTKSLSYRSMEYVLQVRGLARETAITPYGTLVQCCTRSAGQVRRSLISIGTLLYKCSIRSLVWLCVLTVYLVDTRRISSVILVMWRSL
jgi:hypothetical protein